MNAEQTSSNPVPVTVFILDKEYKISCPENEKDALMATARMLDERMRTVRDSGKVLGSERISVITALNLIHELSQDQERQRQGSQDVQDRVRRLTEKVRSTNTSRPSSLNELD